MIDFGPFLNPSDPERQKVATDILSAFTKSGFLYLKNHGVPEPLIARTYSHSAAFFKRPQAEKDALEWSTAVSNRGYACLGREKVSQGLDADAVKEVRETEGEDLKETFDLGRENDPKPGCENPWPKDTAGDLFKTEGLEFFDKCQALHMQIMRAIAVGLGIQENWFDSFTDEGDNTLRLLHYPPVKKSVFTKKKGQVRAGAHSDYGSITLLFQDTRGGLQVQGPHGDWVNATPIEGTVVVNAGDLLMRWSNDLIKSTVHRVIEPPWMERQSGHGIEQVPEQKPAEEGTTDDDHEYPARYSIAYFCNPNFNREVEVIPNILKTGEKGKYDSVNSGDYLVQRLQATF